MILRFDDVCINTDMTNANALADMWRNRMGGEIWYCVSPLVERSNDQRIYPKIYRAMSDYRIYYNVDACGVPFVPHWVTVCSHGLVHVDHRLLDYSAKEMSIITSCNLLRSRIFVPPFNKWDADMVDICADNGIRLVRFEDGWRSIEHEQYTESVRTWYLHPGNVTPSQLDEWLENV